jgi:hypothetical protein
MIRPKEFSTEEATKMAQTEKETQEETKRGNERSLGSAEGRGKLKGV